MIFSVLDTKIALGECTLVRLSVSDVVEMGKIGYAFDVASYGGSFFYILMSLLRNGVGLSFFLSWSLFCGTSAAWIQ